MSKFKSKKFFVCLALVCMALCMSCSDGVEETVYSCNKETNAWVKSHIPEIRKMNRKAWLKSDATKSRAIYIAFTPEQKIQFWRDKLKELSSLNFTTKEIMHIAKIGTFITEHLDFFYTQELSDDQLDILDMWIYKWGAEAQEKFGWSKELCMAIVGTSQSVLDKTGAVAPLNNTGTTVVIKDPNKKPACGCNVKYDYCGITLSGLCVETKCEETRSGCGNLLLNACNGECDAFL